MNHFEQKLARQTLREPPAGLRAEILRACAAASPVGWTWREWLWPSPRAWAALAALWLVCAAVQISDGPAGGSAATAARFAPDGDPLTSHLTVYNTRDFRHVLDLTN